MELVAGGSRPRSLWRLARAATGRLSWGVADQAMSSVSNFAVNIYIARSLGAVQYGAFALAYVTYGFALSASRGLATDPLLVRYSGAELPVWRRAVSSCTATAVATGTAAGALVLGVAVVLHGAARPAFLALGVTLPLLLLQDSWRYAFFALGKGGRAFANDAVWVAALLPLLVLLHKTGHASVFWYVLAWGVASGAGALMGPLQARVLPHVPGARAWLRQTRDLGFRYLLEGTASSAANQLRNYGIGFILGLAAVGYVQAAATLLGPFMVVFYGAGLVTIPEAARVLRRSPQHLPQFCVLVSAALAALALAWGVVLLLALPRGLGQYVLPHLWRSTYPLVLPSVLGIVGGCVSTGAGAGLHALGAARRSMRAMLIWALLSVALGLVGAAAGGLTGTVEGAAAASMAGGVIMWAEFLTAMRERQPAMNPLTLSAGRVAAYRGAAGPGGVRGLALGTAGLAGAGLGRAGLDPAFFRARPATAPSLGTRTRPRRLTPGRVMLTADPERWTIRTLYTTWGLLLLNTLTFFPGLSMLHIPGFIGKSITQGALLCAFLLALALNRHKIIRPSVFLFLVSLLILGALITTSQPQHLGTVYRTFRLIMFVATLWLLTPYWGRRDLLLVRAHLYALCAALGTVVLGLLISPHRARAGGRLNGVIWPMPPTQVAHYAAVAAGLIVVLWFCGLLRARTTGISFAVLMAVLLLTHTRTALVGMVVAVLVAGLSLITMQPRVRKMFAIAGAMAAVAATALSGVLGSWLARGEGPQQLYNLTGRTVVWRALVSFPRTKFQEIFGFGLSNGSFNGLPIDSNWLASYQEQGYYGVAICAAMLLFLLIAACFTPRGVQRALSLFLVVYCLIASITEVGFTDASPYLLDLTLAASLLVPSVASPARMAVPAPQVAGR